MGLGLPPNLGGPRPPRASINVTADWVTDQRVRVVDGTLSHQVNLEVTFVLDEDEHVA